MGKKIEIGENLAFVIMIIALAVISIVAIIYVDDEPQEQQTNEISHTENR